MFFEEQSDDPVSLARAQRLAAAVKKAGRGSPNKGDVGKWAWDLLKIKEKEDVDAVLDWYCKNIAEPFVPLAFSGMTFVAKFDRIKQAMQRTVKIKPSKAAMSLALDLQAQMTFPPEMIPHLPRLIEESICEWAWYNKIAHGCARTRQSRQFIHAVKQDWGNRVIIEWFVHIHNRYGDRPYYGPVDNLAMKIDHPWFRESMWNRWALQWFGKWMGEADGLLDAIIEKMRNVR